MVDFLLFSLFNSLELSKSKDFRVVFRLKLTSSSCLLCFSDNSLSDLLLDVGSYSFFFLDKSLGSCLQFLVLLGSELQLVSSLGPRSNLRVKLFNAFLLGSQNFLVSEEHSLVRLKFDFSILKLSFVMLDILRVLLDSVLEFLVFFVHHALEMVQFNLGG